MIDWTHIMIHHSLTKDSNTVSWNAIRKYHLGQGWLDIGYHFGLELVGDEYEALIGRPLNWEGSHCKEGGMNHKAIGICCVGNYDLVTPESKMLDTLVTRLILPLMRAFKIPSKNIVFHREFATYKSCPGILFTKNMILSRIPGGIV